MPVAYPAFFNSDDFVRRTEIILFALPVLLAFFTDHVRCSGYSDRGNFAG